MEQSSAFVASTTRELGVLARHISLLSGREALFVGNITDLLHRCAQAYQHPSRRAYVGPYSGWTIYDIGCYFLSCLQVSQDYGYPLLAHRFSLYTTGSRLSKDNLLSEPVVMYPRTWYEELRERRCRDDSCSVPLRVMMVSMCKMLHTKNVVLYVSPETPTNSPPWVTDGFLKKRLADNDLPGFVENYEWALSTSFPAPISQPEHPQSLHRQQSIAKSSLNEAYSAPSERGRAHHISRTSNTGDNLQMTETFRESHNMSFDEMDIDRKPGDNLLDSSREGWSPQISRPMLMEADPQSRPAPEIQKVVPAQGSMNGGTEVTLLGNGFYQGLEVVFGDIEATATTFWSDKCLVCVAPPAVKAGNITIGFKEEHGLPNAAQQQPQSRTYVYQYIEDQESGRYGHASTALEHNKQHSRENATYTSQQQIIGLLVMRNNFALITHWAGCLVAHTAPFLTTENYILELSHQSLVSLRHALAVLPLEDETILCAILLWLVEEFRHHEAEAKLHWYGVKVLIQCRPDFSIKRALVRSSAKALSVLTNQQFNSIAEVNKYIVAHFTTKMEDTTTFENVAQSVASSAAPTPAATVYSPWSETDVDPPPYMLSPTPLKEACLIYAAVNAGRKVIRIT